MSDCILRKIASILLLGLFLFNWVGYKLLTFYMEAKADAQLQAQLDDNNYEEDQLVSIKVPVTHLSYYQNSNEFETANGRIEVGGIQYKYVKRRIHNDSLEVLVIPDAAAMKLKAAKNDFFAFVNGLQHGGQEKRQNANTNTSRGFFPEYYSTHDLYVTVGDIWFTIPQKYAQDFFPLSSLHALVPERPPEIAGSSSIA